LGGGSGGELVHDSLLSLFVVESVVGKPLSTLGVGQDEGWLGLDNLLGWLGVTSGLLSVWVGKDGSVDLLEEFLAGLDLGGGEALLPLRELSLEGGGILLLELVHVSGDVVTEDSVSEHGSIELGFSLLDIGGLSSLVGDDGSGGLGETCESLGLM